jgi:hypothetical protein
MYQQEMCASQNIPIYINRVFPLPQGNHVAKFGKDPIYRTKVIVRKPVWTLDERIGRSNMEITHKLSNQ